MNNFKFQTLLQMAFVLAPLVSQAQTPVNVSPAVKGWLSRADSFTCMAYWTGFTYNPSTNTCEQRSASGCSNPFEFLTLDDCEAAQRP